MKQVTQHMKSGEIRVQSVPAPALKPGYILVRTRYSLISAGTERASVSSRKSSLVRRARKQPDLVLKVLDQVRQYGVLQTIRRVRGVLDSYTAMGYSVAGEVVATGSEGGELKPGDRVACMGAGSANHAEYVLVPKNLCAKVPPTVPLDHACFTTVGAIALQGVRQAEPTVGETVVVIGLGLLGLITVEILKASGCRVIGLDLDPAAVRKAREIGADVAVHRSESDPLNIVRSFTQGVGADAVIITAATASSDPVRLAGDLSREKGRVVIVGDVGMDVPRASFYRKELELRLSRSTGPGRYDPDFEEKGGAYPLGYVRWTETRNMQEFLRLIAEEKIDLAPLKTHEFPVSEAKKAFTVIMGKSSERRPIGVVLKYDAGGGDDARVSVLNPMRLAKESPIALAVGFVGAGAFAQSSLLPHISRFPRVRMVGVSTGNGLNAVNVGRQFGFGLATTDSREIFEHSEIGTVFIATRHNLHAPGVISALRAGKHVFVEKPLAVTPDELVEVIRAYSAARDHHGSARASAQDNGSLQQGSILMVGFNRRFAPHALQLKRFLADAQGPLMMQYRVNAGYLPRTHWTQDPKEGGGRIIGEVCHFVDFFQFLTGAEPVKVFAEPIVPGPTSLPDDDSLAITLKFADGSVGVITYVANGDPLMPKERLEVMSTGRSAVLDNFQILTLFQQGKRRVFKLASVDKGHRSEVTSFLNAVSEGGVSPIPFETLVATSRVTFRVLESLRVGVPLMLVQESA